MITNTEFTGSYTENPFWYQHFDLSQIRVVKRAEAIVNFCAADFCCLYVTILKAMNFQNDISPNSIRFFKDHQELLFDMTSMQDGTESCHYTELVGE